MANPPERVLRALAAIVAEKGYQATTIADVVKRAGVSQRVYYGHFESKEEALLSALDSGSSQMLASVLPAFRRGRTWQESVRAAYETMCAFGVEEPEYTRLGAVDMYAVGRRALQTRDRVMEGLEVLLVPGYELAEKAAPSDRFGGDWGGHLRPDPRPGQEERPGEDARAGADGHLHDARALHRRRGGIRTRDGENGEVVTSGLIQAHNPSEIWACTGGGA